ncbi:hypothetical protein O3P69_007879 [Scylla paramamosain]|uniref:Uncharacterized protein n=1 Tax=Scylla paramamosain TaxID=85552 RepID=A0AAW0SBR8_SCYPA
MIRDFLHLIWGFRRATEAFDSPAFLVKSIVVRLHPRMSPPVNNNGVICFQEENTFDTDRCGYCEALLAFTLHPLRPPVITSPFQRRHYCDGYAAFEGSSSRPSLGRTRLTLAALLGPFHDSQREREVEVRWSRGGRLKEAVKE